MAYRPKNTEERIRHRLKISKGHFEKVMKMIDEDAYCIDVLHQLQAVQSGLKETNNIILENHLKNCIVGSKHNDGDKLIEEVMEVFKKTNESK